MEMRLSDRNGLNDALVRGILERYPRVIAATLNKAVQNAQKAVRHAEETQLTLTKPFLKQSTQYEPARSRMGMNMVATVGILDRVKFTPQLVDSEDRFPFNKYIAVPVNVRRKPKGGIPENLRPLALIGKPGFYRRRLSNGNWGMFGNYQGHTTLLYVLKPKTHYNHQYLNFDGAVEDSILREDFARMITEALQRII